jgi:hypothetical protein
VEPSTRGTPLTHWCSSRWMANMCTMNCEQPSTPPEGLAGQSSSGHHPREANEPMMVERNWPVWSHDTTPRAERNPLPALFF